jgi:hypothetical protein
MKYFTLEQAVAAFAPDFPSARHSAPELPSDGHGATAGQWPRRCGHGVDCMDSTSCPYCLTLEAWASAGFPSDWPPRVPEDAEAA